MKEKIWNFFFDLIRLKFWLRSVMHTAKLNFSMFVIEYLGEIKNEFENTLACLSGAQTSSNHEKNWRLKISWHTPFNDNCTGSGFVFVCRFQCGSGSLNFFAFPGSVSKLYESEILTTSVPQKLKNTLSSIGRKRNDVK